LLLWLVRSIQTTIGSLPCRLVDGDGGAAPELAVVLCHGFGAPGDDLVPLASEILALRPELGGRVRFVFPEAPLSLAAFGYGAARAWWHIDVERLAAAAREPSGLAALSREIPVGMDVARRQLIAVVEGVSKSSGLPVDRIVLGGFSQGAMISTDLALRLDERPAGLLVFSGTLLAAPEWERLAARRQGLPVFQAHGQQDPLLPYAAAVALRDLLIRAGLTVDFLPFAGGHTITMDGLGHAAALLAGLLQPVASS
jgi:phospholipase/carboxylesterase